MTTNEYHQRANEFAARYGLRLSSNYVGYETNPNWGKNAMDHWRCRLSSKSGKSYTFSFWMGPGHNGAAPTMYDILASIQKEELGTFEDFCAEFGYDCCKMSEYPRIMKIYNSCKREYNAVCRLLPLSAIADLCEIC